MSFSNPGKVLGILRTREALRHSAQTSDLSREIATLKQETSDLVGEIRKLKVANAAMKELLSEVVQQAEITTRPVSPAWLERARAILSSSKRKKS